MEITEVKFLILILILGISYYIGKFIVYYMVIRGLSENKKDVLKNTILVLIGKSYIENLKKD